jgi:RNA polymerase sigma factor (sigma-70 family)
MTMNHDQPETLEERIARMYEMYRPFLLGIAQKWGVPSSNAEDVSQIVFINLWRYLIADKTVDLRKERAWLRQVTIRESIRWCQTHHRGDGQQRRPESAHPPSDRDPTISAVVNKEREEILREALALLPPEIRKAVEACDYQEMSVTEFSQQEGISRKAAERRRNKGRRLLREMPEAHQADFPP